MGKQKLKKVRHNQTITEFWRQFRPFATRFDEYGLDHWYLITIGSYLFLIILDLIRQIQYFQGIYLLSFTTRTYGLRDWIVVSTLITLSLVALAFNRWRHQISRTFQGLFEKGRLVSASNNFGQEFQSFFEEYQHIIQSKKQYFLVGGLMILTLILTWPPIGDQIIFLATSDPIRATGMAFINVLGPLLWTYFGAIGAWVMFVTGIFLRKFTDRFALHIQPSHPDKCGGLRSLGDFCLGIAVPILIGAVFLSIFSFGGVLNKAAPIVIAANVGLLVFALPLSTVAFFAPLWNVHRKMVEERRKYEDEFAAQLAKVEEKIRASFYKGEVEALKGAKEELEVVQLLHPDKIGFPEWPFDRSILIRFLTPQIMPIISLVASISDPLAEAIRSAISIFSKP